MENIESLKAIERCAEKGFWIAQLKQNYELKDLFESIRFYIQKIKEDNNLDWMWREKRAHQD